MQIRQKEWQSLLDKQIGITRIVKKGKNFWELSVDCNIYNNRTDPI
jgi:hypothetical protein